MGDSRTDRGRPPYGSPEKPKSVKFGISMPPDMDARLRKYCADDERDVSWAIRKALDEWLAERGY